jgi:hypothetical protein
MATVTIHVDGVEETLKALAALGPALEQRVLRRAARNSSKVVLAAAQANLAPRTDTGALARGLRVRIQKTRKRYEGRIAYTVQTPTRKELAKLYPERADEMMTSKWYFPAAIEYGYTRRGRTYAAVPFMRQAFASTGGTAANMMKTELRAGLDREVKRLARVAAKAALNAGGGGDA